MARESFRRMAGSQRPPEELRLGPPPQLPERLTRAFPEMARWGDEMREWSGKQTERIRIALEEANQEGSDYVAIFEENL